MIAYASGSDTARRYAERLGKITYTSNIVVQPIATAGGDWLVCDAARVSSQHAEGRGPRELTEADLGLLRNLIEHRHGAPFSHGSLTFFVEAPIFVFREWRTHRVWMYQTEDMSGYSEASARYRPLKPLFWIPSPDRPMMRAEGFKPMQPKFLPPNEDSYAHIVADLRDSYAYVWQSYTDLLDSGVASEVARAVLPVGIFSAMYVTCNPRSLMHFCSLRVHDSRATFVSYPQHEIDEAARAAERLLAEGWPHTYRLWVDAGRYSV